ncbi:hypothetical protein [Flavobacterium sp.]|jgi:hypothetical protein|uniref:hypothetical protein n=1 Tax=Flavobacterium sp. TaxID=239 RepID=UPI0037BE6252
MKTRNLKSIVLIALCFTALAFNKTQAQTYNHLFTTIDVLNNLGQNPHDFAFSYDVINGQSTCNINFEVISNLNIISTFRFKIYFNEVDVYTGIVTTQPFGKVFFDNALLNCNVNNSVIKIVILN